MNENIKESARILLSEIIDYAGLFPPTGLPMNKSVQNYALYKISNFNWMLGRFVVPVARLDEFTEYAENFFSRSNNEIWKLSVLASEDTHETVRRIEEFNKRFAPKAVCDMLEVKIEGAFEIENLSAHAPPNLKIFFELPLDEQLADLVATVAVKKHSAKIRTGGLTPESFPSTDQIAKFVRTCLAANVSFKCTAGLHHPLRCVRALTYEPNAPKGTMNGFLNVFLAAAFLMQGYKPKLIHELLEDEWAEHFAFNNNGIVWRHEHFVSNTQLQTLRARGAISFGSCSFDEPIEDLQAIGIL